MLLPLVTWVAEHADEIVNSPGAAGSGEAVDTTVATNAADGQAAP